MPDIITSIKNDFAHAIVERCEEKGCTLRLDRLGNYVALKGESITPQKQICDYIIFKPNEYIIVGVIELKGKNPDAREVIEQLKKGKAIALDILLKYENVTNRKFCFLALARGWGDPSQIKKIENSYIDVEGKKYWIKRRRCGISFNDAIKD